MKKKKYGKEGKRSPSPSAFRENPLATVGDKGAKMTFCCAAAPVRHI
jgi:hypothetical protein